MGIHDHDYMKDSNQDDVFNLNEILLLLVKLVVVFVLFVVSLRFPVVWIKFPLAFVVLVYGWRWIFKAKKDSSSRSSASGSVKQIENRQAGAEPRGGLDQEAIRTLIAYDAAGEFGKAKALIQQLNGDEFSEPMGKELAAVAGNYFPIELEPTEKGVRFKLV